MGMHDSNIKEREYELHRRSDMLNQRNLERGYVDVAEYNLGGRMYQTNVTRLKDKPKYEKLPPDFLMSMYVDEYGYPQPLQDCDVRDALATIHFQRREMIMLVNT